MSERKSLTLFVGEEELQFTDDFEDDLPLNNNRSVEYFVEENYIDVTELVRGLEAMELLEGLASTESAYENAWDDDDEEEEADDDEEEEDDDQLDHNPSDDDDETPDMFEDLI